MKKLIFSLVAVAAASAAPAAWAGAPLELKSDIFVEKQQKRPDGTLATKLVTPNLIIPGDRLVFVVHYKNAGTIPASNIAVTNPIPRAISFSGTSDGNEIVSVDGGKSWGKINQLRVSNSDGSSRAAGMADVTHIRWTLNQTLAAGAAGKLIFRGVVK
ncbi:hypothetical protein [Sphingorhabdus sp.]|jgi:uncharacterized repeat protein (TIGR01451 family)|uniref:hypothetical protein n=1 Tax=Sphingorhabdus sp. TaxID=1902408 RepID=UPI003BB05C16|nr:hypothetical protein [Sphingomonadales bacterium]MBK9431877.1 hypothetical protein [Sphingomonadales bacterium]MBL0022840.1 hypothetical protein [Sphingomonadales bacterium]